MKKTLLSGNSKENDVYLCFLQHAGEKKKKRKGKNCLNINSVQWNYLTGIQCVCSLSLGAGKIKESHYGQPDSKHNRGGDAANNTCAHHSG